MDFEFSVRYLIDADDRISFVDDGWCRFAAANGSEELMPPTIIGQSLWDHIIDETTARLYRQIVSGVRKGDSTCFTLRCDGPECRRLLEMTITAGPDGSVEFQTHPIQLERREPVALLARDNPRSDRLLRSCAWCNRFDVSFGSDEWVEAEEAATRLRLFENERMPQLTHGICNGCFTKMKTKVPTAA